MGRGRHVYKYCKVCGKPRTADDPISGTGLCREHWNERLTSNNNQLHEHEGPYFENWRRRSAAAYGAVQLKDLIPLLTAKGILIDDLFDTG